jgi:hypothetical protein
MWRYWTEFFGEVKKYGYGYHCWRELQVFGTFIFQGLQKYD